MVNRIALVTASFGALDGMRPIPSCDGIDTFFYTDARTLAPVVGWKSVVWVDYPSASFHPRLRAKYFKLQIHRLEEVQPYDWLIWADSSFSFSSLDFLVKKVDALRLMPAHKRAAFIPHPQRNSVSQEYKFIIDQMKSGNDYLISRYGNDNMAGQMEFLAAKQSSSDYGLLCGGLWIVENSRMYHDFLNDWWDQVLRYSIMDQLSLSYALDFNGIEAETLGVPLYGGQYFTIGHG
jgi:hypothetical protein